MSDALEPIAASDPRGQSMQNASASEAGSAESEETPASTRLPSTSVVPVPIHDVDGLPLTPFERLVAAECDGARCLAELKMLRGLPPETVRSILVRLVAWDAIALVRDERHTIEVESSDLLDET